MKHFSQNLLYTGLAALAACGLTGCGAGSPLPASPIQVTISDGIQGNNYGGHAPIVGAKVFLLQAGTSGYGSKSTSLLTSAAGNTDTSIVGSTGSPAYYVNTDSAGGFNITGDYTCTAGLPVYLYAVSGSPDTDPSVGYSYLQSATGNGTTVTFVVDEEKFYVGQQVLINGIPPGNPFVSLNGTYQAVSAISTTGNTGFSISSTLVGSSSSFGAIATAIPQGVPNPAIVNVAVLGNCPTSAPFTFGAGSSDQINFVYMNEVSTAAAMFALAPFAETSTISGGVVTRTGTDAQHIGIPASDTLALTGIQNAANNAGLLYDITGTTNNASTADGEAHVARTAVPNSGTQGSGPYASVPNLLINTLGNVLAACVDSANTKGIASSSGSYSIACSKLFSTATADGTTTGTNPSDTATAAINIAHYPAGNGNSSFVSNLYTLPTGVVPFTPMLLSQPNDFVIGLNITDNNGSGVFLGTAAKPNGIAVDANGNVFVTTTGCAVGCTIQFPPTLLPETGISYTAGGTGVAVDPNGKVWVVNASQTSNGGNGPSGAFYVSSLPLAINSFTGYGTYNSNFAKGTLGIAIDGTGVAYVSDSAETYVHKITALGAAPAFTQYLMQGPTTFPNVNCETDITAIAVDNKAQGYNIWTAGSATASVTQGMCAIANTASTQATSATGPVNTATLLSQIGPQYTPTSIAVDANGTGWDTNSAPGAPYNQTGEGFPNCFPCSGFNAVFVFANGSGANGIASTAAGPSGIAFDGNNNLWQTNFGTNTVAVYKNGGKPTGLATPGNPAISPSTGYSAGGTISGPTKLAIDPSGDVWVINTGTLGTEGYSITELIGVAAPTYAPLSSATLNNKLGAKP